LISPWFSVLGFSDSTKAECTRASVGLHVDPTLAQLLCVLHRPSFAVPVLTPPSDIKDVENTINSTLTSVLVLHPVTCALTFLALLVALHAAWRPSRRASFLTMIIAGLAALIGTIVFFIDVAVVAISEKDLKKATDDVLDITWGNAVSPALAHSSREQH
jgi:hypothetical protein